MSLESERQARKSVFPPWEEHPFRLISWYDMNRFIADKFVRVGATLEWFGGLFEKGSYDDTTRGMLLRECRRLETDLKEIGCNAASMAAFRLATDLEIMIADSDLKPRVLELKDAIIDEM